MKEKPHHLSPYCNTRELPPWGLTEVVFAFLLAFVAVSLVTSALLSTLFAQVSSFAKLIISHLASYLVWVIIVLTLFKRYGVSAFKHLGLRLEKPFYVYLYDGFACGGLILLIGWMMGYLAQHFGWSYQQPFQAFTTPQMRLIAILAIFTAPFLEELAFRGFLQYALYRYMKVFPAILLTALLFTFFHTLYYGNILAMLYVVLMGIVLGCFRHVSKSTIPSIIGHFINNVLAAIVLLEAP